MRDDLDHDRGDDRLNAEAQTIMRYATVADLKADCAELSKLYAELDEHDRERMLVLVFGPDG